MTVRRNKKFEERRKELRSKQFSSSSQAKPSNYQIKTTKKWTPKLQTRRNSRGIKTARKKSPIWRRIEDLKSRPEFPAAVALSIIGTILAIWKINSQFLLSVSDLPCHFDNIFIICLIETHTSIESSTVFNLLGMQPTSYLWRAFYRWFLIKTWTEVFVKMKGRIVRLQFLLLNETF